MILLTCCATVVLSDDINQGAPSIELKGGEKGNIEFPHHRHQTVLNDCAACHETFPQQPGIIQKMKDDGQLEKKQVMNRLCVKCHKERKQDGQSYGPLTCRQCHSIKG
jgi:uncharacterized membrane protein